MPLSIIYGLITSLRNFIFDIGIFNSKKFNIPIICIGNLSVGGNGKTPHVNYLANTLNKKYNVAIISRGYKRKNYNFLYVETNSNVKDVGDEPLMLKQRNPEAIVVVCGNRTKAINKLIKENPKIDIILLDDGYQHRWVNAGLNLLLTNINKPFYKDYLLPYGNLRESKKQCKRADYLIITNSHKVDNTLKNEIASNVSKYCKKEIFFSGVKYQKPIGIYNNNILDNITKRKIVLVTGIADSIELKNYLNKKTEIIKHFEFADHHNYNKEDIMDILSYYKSLKDIKKLILTTEKDATKLRELLIHFEGVNLYYISIDIAFSEQENFDRQILNYVAKN